MGKPNTSAAIKAQRKTDYTETLDDFPTPLWCTRAFLHHAGITGAGYTAIEPCTNRGFMADVLHDADFDNVFKCDIVYYDYPLDRLGDYLDFNFKPPKCDYMITNPPFKFAEKFIKKGLTHCDTVCVFVRLQFVESVGRFERLFNTHRPSAIYQYAERCGLDKGQVLAKPPNAAMSFCWMVFDSEPAEQTIFNWIPPCKSQFEKPGDYPENQVKTPIIQETLI